jgi:hypothetical protein
MFKIPERTGLRRPSAGIRRALVASGLAGEVDLADVSVVVTRGQFADSPVTLFRAFVPERAVARGVDVLSAFGYAELNAHLDLVLRAGYIGQDGLAVVFSPPVATEPAPMPRPNA